MILERIEELKKLREKHRDKKIVFCSGTFDMTHAGHILFFEDCKKQGDVLVVGVGGDAITKKRKGDKRPILNEHIRVKTIDSLKAVDYCLIDRISVHDDPLKFIDAVFENLSPDVSVINEDAFDIPYRKELCKEYNVKLVILPRWFPPEFDGISTSKIIEKVKSLDD